MCQGITAAGTYKHERVITSSQGRGISVASLGSRRVLNFCANNYLGLSDDAGLKAAAKAAIDSHGLGLSSVRFICGTQDLHKTLEHKIAGHTPSPPHERSPHHTAVESSSVSASHHPGLLAVLCCV